MDRLRRICTLAAIAATLCLPSSVSADNGEAAWLTEQEISKLINQLGSDEFAEREEAARRLTEAGAFAFDALDTAKESDDTEVRLRAELVEQAIVNHAVKELEKFGAQILPGQRHAPLRLGYKYFGDEQLKHVACLRTLMTLELTKSRVTDQGLLCLRHLPNLSEILLRDTRVSDAGLVHLSSLQSLTRLDVYGCPISDQGLAAIGKFENLRFLSLSGSDITDKGMQHFAKLRRLDYLRLDCPNVTGAGLVHLRSARKHLRVLRLQGVPMKDQDLKLLKDFTSLESLYIREAPLSGVGLSDLSQLPKLKRIYLDHSQVNDDAIHHLRSLHALTCLSLDGTNVTLGGLSGLRNAPQLSNLELPQRFTDHEVNQLQYQLNRERVGPRIHMHQD